MTRDSYSYKKYQKELAKKKKKEEKEQRKRAAPRLIGMPSAPLSVEASNEDAAAV